MQGLSSLITFFLLGSLLGSLVGLVHNSIELINANYYLHVLIIFSSIVAVACKLRSNKGYVYESKSLLVSVLAVVSSAIGMPFFIVIMISSSNLELGDTYYILFEILLYVSVSSVMLSTIFSSSKKENLHCDGSEIKSTN